MYKGQARRIKDVIKALLAEIQLNGSAAFENILGSTDQQFDAFPSVCVLPGQLEDGKSSVAQNDHTVAYIVRIYSRRESAAEGEEAQIDLMYDLTDKTIDALDQAWQSGRLTQIDPLVRTYLMTSEQGNWSEVETDAGVLLMTDVNLRVTYVKNNG